MWNQETGKEYRYSWYPGGVLIYGLLLNEWWVRSIFCPQISHLSAVFLSRERWKCWGFKYSLQNVKWTSTNKVMQGEWSPAGQKWTRRTGWEDFLFLALFSYKQSIAMSTRFVSINWTSFKLCNERCILHLLLNDNKVRTSLDCTVCFD